jgi:hypothetical protein
LALCDLKYTETVQVIKAMTYLLDTVPTCELHIDSVRLSLQGDVKLSMPSVLFSTPADPLVPNVHYQSPQEECIANYQCNSAFLVRILEVLMSHGTSSDKGWSQEALEFSSIPSSDSLMLFMNVSLSVRPL